MNFGHPSDLGLPRVLIHALLCLTGILTSFAKAQEPTIQSVFPVGWMKGHTTRVRIQGTNLQASRQLWMSYPLQSTTVPATDRQSESADQALWDVHVPIDAPMGLQLIRLVTDNGVSTPRLVLIDDLALSPTPLADHASAAPVSEGPMAYEGTLPNLTYHYVKLRLEAGKAWSIEIWARRLGSPLDPVVRLFDPQRREVLLIDDTAGLNGDLQAVFVPTLSGEYLLELRDVRYEGGYYRLRLGDFPLVQANWPLAVTRGREIEVLPAGVFIEGVSAQKISIPQDTPLGWYNVGWKRTEDGHASAVMAPITSKPQQLEVEPNDHPEQAQVCDSGADINGRFDRAGDIDRFRFSAEKDQSWTFRGFAQQLGSPADLVLKIADAAGNVLVNVDDTTGTEAIAYFKAPARGDYQLIIEELAQRGGSPWVYHIEVLREQPAFLLQTSTETLNIPRGGRQAFTVQALRYGYNGAIEITAEGLPDGYIASSTIIGEGRGEALMTIQAPADAPAASIYPLRILGTPTQHSVQVQVEAHHVSVLRQRWANLRNPLAPLAQVVTLGVAPPPAFTWDADPSHIVLSRNLSASVTLKAVRTAGWDEAITLSLLPQQNPLPPGITPNLSNFDKGSQETKITFTANNQAPLGDFAVGLLATQKVGNVTATQPLVLRLQVRPVLDLNVHLEATELRRGSKTRCEITVSRNPALQAAVTLSAFNLPTGVRAEPVVLPVGADRAVLWFEVDATAPLSESMNLQIKAEALQADHKYEALSGKLTVKVVE